MGGGGGGPDTLNLISISDIWLKPYNPQCKNENSRFSCCNNRSGVAPPPPPPWYELLTAGALVVSVPVGVGGDAAGAGRVAGLVDLQVQSGLLVAHVVVRVLQHRRVLLRLRRSRRRCDCRRRSRCG